MRSNSGTRPWVVRDAVASNATRHRANEIHESALLHISRLVGAGQVIDSSEVQKLLTHQPGEYRPHPAVASDPFGASERIAALNVLVLVAMPTSRRLPPTKPVGTNLSYEVCDALDAAVAERGLSKRALFEIALRRELGLPNYPSSAMDGQEELPISA